MRFGEKCKEKTTKMTEDSPRVTDLINNANFLLNVSILCHFHTQIDGNYHKRYYLEYQSTKTGPKELSSSKNGRIS